MVLEEETAALARALGGVLPPDVGFALVTFNFGTGSIAYASNGTRETVVCALRELLDKMVANGDRGA